MPLSDCSSSEESVSGKESGHLVDVQLDGDGFEGDAGQVRYLVAVDLVGTQAPADGVTEEEAGGTLVELSLQGVELTAALAQPEPLTIALVCEEAGRGALEGEWRHGHDDVTLVPDVVLVVHLTIAR